MRTIIAGSRNCTDIRAVNLAVQLSGFIPTLIVSGDARGADKLGQEWAANNHVPCSIYPAQWDTYGKSAGYRRNEEMAKHADALVAVWDGKSSGTKHMIDIAKREELRVFVLTDNDVPPRWDKIYSPQMAAPYTMRLAQE